MTHKKPFKHNRFSAEVILCAIRFYLYCPLSYADTFHLLAQRGTEIDRAKAYLWALNRLLRTGKGFRRLHSTKATLKGIEAIRTIKHNHIRNIQSGVKGEIEFVNRSFDLAA